MSFQELAPVFEEPREFAERKARDDRLEFGAPVMVLGHVPTRERACATRVGA